MLARGILLTSLVVVLACSAKPSPRPGLPIPEPAVTKPAPSARVVDRFSTLTFERELALPAEVRPIRGFIGDGSRFWVRESLDAWLLHAIGRDEPERSLRGMQLGHAQYLDDSLALLILNQTIYGHDTVSGERRFRTNLVPPARAVQFGGAGARPSLADVHVAANELYVLLSYIMASELVALDRRSGALLWRATAERGFGRTLCAASGHVVFATPDGYEAHGGRAGDLAWSLPLAPRKRPLEPVEPLVRCSGGWVALFGVSQDELSLVELATGKVRASFPAETQVVDAAFTGNLLIAQARRGEASRLLAIDTARLQITWQSQPIVDDSAPSLRLLGAHALLATNAFVQIYEPERGALVWHWGGANEGPIALAERSGVPELAFAADKRVLFFKAASTPAPTEAVTLRGTVTYDGAPAANISVVAYGAETKTDAQGRYSLSLEARGTIRIVALTPHHAEAVVTLDGRGTYDVKIDALEECPEGCE